MAGDDAKRPGTLPSNRMLYEVLVVSNGGAGERFTIERAAPLSYGDTFNKDFESYRVLAVQPGSGTLRWCPSKPSG